MVNKRKTAIFAALCLLIAAPVNIKAIRIDASEELSHIKDIAKTVQETVKQGIPPITVTPVSLEHAVKLPTQLPKIETSVDVKLTNVPTSINHVVSVAWPSKTTIFASLSTITAVLGLALLYKSWNHYTKAQSQNIQENDSTSSKAEYASAKTNLYGGLASLAAGICGIIAFSNR